LNKTVKRIIALGTGAAMLGATVLGAMAAADLSAYPKPFVDNGKFNGLIVVGANAIGTDTLGAADILASLQAANTVTETISGTTETVVEGGVKIETSSTKLTYGSTLSTVKSILTSADLPVLLAKSTITDNDGKTYDVLTQLDVLNSVVSYAKTSDFTEPTLYLGTTGTEHYDVEIQFPTAIDFSDAKGETLKIFGKDYVISDKSGEITNTTLTLYKAALDQTFTAGAAATTVTVGGTDVIIEVIGVSTGSTGATIKINGETKSVAAGSSYRQFMSRT